MNIPGLPEGVVCTRFGKAKPGEYEIMGGRIVKATREDSVSQVIVQPAPGWSLLAQPDGSFISTKMLQEPKPLTLTAKFVVTNEYDARRVADLESRLKEFGAVEVAVE